MTVNHAYHIHQIYSCLPCFFLSLSSSFSNPLAHTHFSGSVCNASGTNSDEGDTSDDQTDYNKVDTHSYNNKNAYSGSNYDYKAFPANVNNSCISKSTVQVKCSDSFSGESSNSSSSCPNEFQSKHKLQKVSFLPHSNKNVEYSISGAEKGTIEISESTTSTAHDEALLSMMSFFSHCHKVESEKSI